MLEEAIEQVETVNAGKHSPAPLVLAHDERWHAGVIGIVASRLKERYNRPAIVVAWEGGAGKASCRSVPGVDIGAAITAARQADLLVNGGGHPMAAGFTVERSRLDALSDFLRARLADAVDAVALAPSLGLDGALGVEGATADLLEMLEAAGPYGAGNPEPRFAIAGAQIMRADIVGRGHVRCQLAGRSGKRLKGIAFRAADNALGHALLAGAEHPVPPGRPAPPRPPARGPARSSFTSTTAPLPRRKRTLDRPLIPEPRPRYIARTDAMTPSSRG